MLLNNRKRPNSIDSSLPDEIDQKNLCLKNVNCKNVRSIFVLQYRIGIFLCHSKAVCPDISYMNLA